MKYILEGRSKKFRGPHAAREPRGLPVPDVGDNYNERFSKIRILKRYSYNNLEIYDGNRQFLCVHK